MKVDSILFSLIAIFTINLSVYPSEAHGQSTSKTDSLPKVDPMNNMISIQLLGDTPYLGLTYSRRHHRGSKSTPESGVGFGYRPSLFSNRHITISHHHTLILTNTSFVKPSITYSGLGINDALLYSNPDRLRYTPVLQAGMRFGKPNGVGGYAGIIASVEV